MNFYVHKGRVAIRVGRYWVCYEPGNVTNGKRYASAKRAIAAPTCRGRQVMDVQTNCKKCGHDLAGWHSCGHCLTWNGQDFDAVLKERDALQGKLKVAIDTIKAHNDSCESMCGLGDQEGVACGYRPYFPRHCPECTLHDRIWDVEGRQLLHEALAQLDLPKSG